MSSPFLAEIRIFPYSYNPRGWAFCNGQSLSINQNTALFALIGVTYGGDGRTSFNLPNLQGAFPVQPGQGAGLSAYSLGQKGGAATVALTSQQMAAHSHPEYAAVVTTSTAPDAAPGGDLLLQANPHGTTQLFGSDAATTPMAAAALGSTGGSQSHNNLPPYLVLNYCIALQGVFPQRP